MNQFIETVLSESDERELPRIASRFVLSGESVRVIGEGSRKILVYPFAVSGFNVAAILGWLALLPTRDAGQLVVAGMAFAGSIATVALFVWLLRGSVVLFSNARILIVHGRSRPCVAFETAISSVVGIVVRTKRLLGLSLDEYLVELRDGRTKTLGILRFHRIAV